MAFALKKTKSGTAPSGPKPPKQAKRAKADQGPKRPSSGGGRGQKFILMVGDEGGILVYMTGKKVVRRLFAPSPQGEHTEAMVELMRAHPRVPVWVLADVLDQQYVRQSFPPVSSMSVGGLVRRRLDRDFHAEDLKGSLPLGRDKTGRKEWHYLLIALVKTPLISGWIDLIVELPNEFKGIHLVPLEAVVYFAMLSKAVHGQKALPWQLLVSHNKVSGFRQVVMRQGKIVFTRVTQALDDAIPAVIAGNIEQEVINTIEYLRRLDFQDNGTLEALVIVSQDVSESLDLARFAFGRTHALTPMDVADALGFEQAALSADSYGDVVMSAAFGAAPKRALCLMTAYAEKLGKLYLATKALMGVVALAGVALLGLSSYNLWDIKEMRTAIEEVDGKRERAMPELANLKKSVSELSEDIAFKSAIVSTYESYLKDAIEPVAFASHIAPLLKQEPRLNMMDWQYQSNIKPGSPSASPPPSAGGTLPDTPIVVKVEFSFNEKYPTVEALTAAFQQFLAGLKQALPQYDITHEALPWAKDTKQNMEITLDQAPKADSAIKEGQNRVILTFAGPKKGVVPPAAGGATP